MKIAHPEDWFTEQDYYRQTGRSTAIAIATIADAMFYGECLVKDHIRNHRADRHLAIRCMQLVEGMKLEGFRIKISGQDCRLIFENPALKYSRNVPT